MGKIKKFFEIIKEAGVVFSVRYDVENEVFLFTITEKTYDPIEVTCEVYPDEIGPSIHYILENMLMDLLREKEGR